jgi:EmrB/QacA subfamily drug resistance transporter
VGARQGGPRPSEVETAETKRGRDAATAWCPDRKRTAAFNININNISRPRATKDSGLTEISVTPAERRLTLAALAVVVLLSALDQTIVATAMPRIIEELRGMSMYAWVTTAYMLTSTVAVPIYGKLSDLYGRKPILIAGVLLFLTGSALCGLSGEFGALPLLGSGMMQLILFRAIQGLGAGALMTVSFAIMADLYPPRERGRLFGVFGSVFGLATVIGPFIGGFFTDHGTVTVLDHEVAGWRWVFYVNLPLGLAALFMILFRMPVLRRGGGGRIDYLGAVLVVLTAATLLLALTLGGTTYAWDSPRILGLFVVGAISLALFLWVETHAVNAILPLRLLRIPTFRITALASFVMSMAFLGVVMFMPLYMQVVQGINATQSGVALLPLMGGMIVSSILCGRLVTRTGRYKPFMIGGGLLLLGGVMTLATIGPDTTTHDLAWRLALTGIGLGPAQTLFSLVIQNSVPATEIGVATSMSQFSRQMGATVGVAIFGTFVTHGLTMELPRHVPLLPGTSEHHIDLAHAQSQAMNAAAIRERVTRALDERYEVVERALREDPAAVDEIVGDPRMPEQIKESLRNGGVRGQVHRQLLERASAVEAELKAGETGRDRLLRDPELPPGVKQQLANIPARAFGDGELMEGVANLFRDAILAKESSIAAASIQQTVLAARAAMTVYANQLIERTQRGMKIAFATAIVHMLERARWIVALAVIVVLFIPELPLRSRSQSASD